MATQRASGNAVATRQCTEHTVTLRQSEELHTSTGAAVWLKSLLQGSGMLHRTCTLTEESTYLNRLRAKEFFNKREKDH